MFKKLKELIFQTFTGRDNKTLDLGRILRAKGVLIFFGLSIYDIYRGSAFDASTWGIGLGAVLAAGGAALAMKAGTEPTE
jgi:hypothetical protein